jgi:hypothetical protein
LPGYSPDWSARRSSNASSPEHREFSWPKLIAALMIEGAIFRLIKGLTDHGARRAFAKGTGSWPGEERPQSE